MVTQGTYIYKVSELTAGIKTILEDSFTYVWIEGELSNFKSPSSGHLYFTLKDQRSELRCVCFKSDGEKLKFKLKNGMHVICSGRISVYEKQGVYQLYVRKVEPRGLGVLELAFRQLKEKLFKEGLFDEAHKRPIPRLPNRIGIVTSPTGAAIRDMLHVLKRRFSNIGVVINPVKVQGVGSEEEISCAIKDLNNFTDIDVIIITRGGGSLEDLWAFNEEIVARAIYNSEIPVISAVGHEIDWTISDFVADLRAPTPSAAAELVVPEKKDFVGSLDIIEEKLKSFPLEITKEYEQRLDMIEEDMIIRFKHYIELKKRSFELVSEKMQILSPLGILKRGYSISFESTGKKVLKDVKSIKKGDLIETRLFKGIFKSRVEE